LNDLINDDARRVELGRRARARALEFSPAKMAARYVAAYRDCMPNAVACAVPSARARAAGTVQLPLRTADATGALP
jgi:hypothetical protein